VCAYSKSAGKDWIGCEIFRGVFHITCSGLAVATHIEMLKDTSSLWLYGACLPNLRKYLPTTDAIDENCDFTDALDVNDRVNKTLESGRLAAAQHSTNLRVHYMFWAMVVQNAGMPHDTF
jgi:hypothetical protein